MQPIVVCRAMVRIDGATGVHAGFVNGFYEPTEEMVGHASVYRKVGDADTWIEYHESSGGWWIKTTSYRGKAVGYASAVISPPKPLEECPLSCWEVGTGGGKCEKQSSLTICTTTMAAFEAYEAAKVIYMVLIVHIRTYNYHLVRAWVIVRVNLDLNMTTSTYGTLYKYQRFFLYCIYVGIIHYKI